MRLNKKQDSSDSKISLNYGGYVHSCGEFVKQSFSGRKVKF